MTQTLSRSYRLDMRSHSFHKLFAPGLALVYLCCAFPARAAETSPIQCGANEDRVWVYDSLDSFDVSLKLKCGEPVEIISRAKGYVKIRTSTGKEGYVPEKALPKPPDTEENNQNSGPAQSSSSEGPQSIAAAARAKTSPSSAPGPGPKPIEPASTNVNQTKSTAGAHAPAQDSNSAASSTAQTTAAAAANTNDAALKMTSIKSVSVSSASAVAATSAPAAPAKIELADNLPSEPVTPSVSIHAAPSPRDPDEEEEPVMKPLESKEVCRIYFSAYGLSPNQYKWMTRNRGKNFPGICPAPAPGMVDFIIIFTHDADFYNGTMPTPAHTDKNGFSDFTPLTTVDTTVVSPSDADKNRREYVWVFHTKRGTFDPAKFSPKRRPLFSTTESNKLGTAAGGRSAEDALRFIEQHGVDR